VISRLKAANIALVYYGGYPQEMGTLVRQAADQAYAAQWFTGSGMASKEFAAVGGKATDGVLMTFNPDPRKREEAASIVGAFKSQGIDPEGFTLYGYAAVQAVALAANKAKSTDAPAVEKALKAERYDTILGNVGFDGKGDITAPGYVLYVWKDGSFDYPK
jgi:branched-chain amino acid transport system substrate-binding protein